MGTIAAINGITLANISAVKSIAKTDVEAVLGQDKAGATVIYSDDFNSNTGTISPSSTTLPTGWAKADSGNMTIFGSTVDDDLGSTSFQNGRGWVFEHGESNSTSTGVGGGMADGIGATDGAWHVGATSNGDSGYRYLLFEASGFKNKANMIRTGAFDFSSFTSITLTMWIHLYGANHNAFGIAATTNASSADSSVEAGSGLGFTSYTAGGCTISYDSNGDGTLDGSTQRFTSQINSDGDQFNESQTAARKWRKASIDLSAAAGESTVYLYFMAQTDNSNRYYWADVAIDNILIEGT